MLFYSKALEWEMLLMVSCVDTHTHSIYSLYLSIDVNMLNEHVMSVYFVCVNLKWNFHFKIIWKEIDDAPASLHLLSFSSFLLLSFARASPRMCVWVIVVKLKGIYSIQNTLCLVYFHQFVFTTVSGLY